MLNECERAKPNLVYILAGDMGYGEVSCLGPSSKIHPRRLDRMAAGGMIFEDARGPSAGSCPVCRVYVVFISHVIGARGVSFVLFMSRFVTST